MILQKEEAWYKALTAGHAPRCSRSAAGLLTEAEQQQSNMMRSRCVCECTTVMLAWMTPLTRLAPVHQSRSHMMQTTIACCMFQVFIQTYSSVLTCVWLHRPLAPLGLSTIDNQIILNKNNLDTNKLSSKGAAWRQQPYRHEGQQSRQVHAW